MRVWEVHLYFGPRGSYSYGGSSRDDHVSLDARASLAARGSKIVIGTTICLPEAGLEQSQEAHQLSLLKQPCARDR